MVATHELMDPTTGEIVDGADTDGLITAYENVSRELELLRGARAEIACWLAARTSGDTRTRRLAGKTRLVKIEMPSTTWDNSRLKEAWHAYPQFREKYLRIAEVAPQLIEVNKLRDTTGESDLETFKRMVLSAEREPTGTPYVKVEK